MSCPITPVHGTGFVIYDEYDGNTQTCSRNIDDFIQKLVNYAKTSDFYKHIDFAYPEFTIEDLFNQTPLTEIAAMYDHYTKDDTPINSSFVNLKDESVYPSQMIVVWTDKQPSMYNAPYATKEEFIQAMKDTLTRIGFTDCLPDDFDYEAHIGEFSTCAY